MPIYEYEIVRADGSAGRRFEIQQSIHAAPLTHHPETGEPVQRVISVPRVAGRFSDMKLNRTLKDDRKLGELGFTKYVRNSDGKLERRAGQGPPTLTP